MKTAFELANSDKPFTDRFLGIQEYGRQCAEQALKDAARNAKNSFNMIYDSEIEQIENTPIKTP